MTTPLPRNVVRCVVLVLCCAVGCSETKAPTDVADAAQRRILYKNLAERVFAPTYAAFASSAASLAQATAKYADSMSADDLVSARAAFAAAMAVWQHAELFQVGPSASASRDTAGGKGLRQQIYAWPLVNRCGVSRALVEQAYASEGTFAAIYENARGLGALELLLFDASRESGCAKTNSIITSGAWAKLDATELAARRATYAKAAAADVTLRARELEQTWLAFAPELASAGDGSKLYARTQDALNALSNALFYLDTETKDMKLAQPLGLDGSCAAASCAARVEHPYAKISKASIQANLEAFRDIFRGLPPARPGDAMWGLRDSLRSISAGDLVQEMDGKIDASLQALAPLQSLELAIEASENAVPMQAYEELRGLTDLLKSTFIARLALQPPMRAAGDND